MLCPRPLARIRPRRAVAFLFLLAATYQLSVFLFSPATTPRAPQLSGHKGYLRAVEGGVENRVFGFGHRGMVDGPGGSADDDDALDEDVPDEAEVAAEQVVVLRHDPDIVKSPPAPSDNTDLPILSSELAKVIDNSDPEGSPLEPAIKERLQPPPKQKSGKKPGGRMENMRKAIVATGPNAAMARRVRKLIRSYANTWYQRYVLSLFALDPSLIILSDDSYDWIDPETGDTVRAPWRSDTIKALRDLAGCLEDRECGKEGKKVVIASSFFFGGVLYGATSGESIW